MAIIELKAPSPHVNDSDDNRQRIITIFDDKDASLELSAEENYPVCESWAEIAVAASFVSGVIATHYLDKILDAFDSWVLKKYDQLNLDIRCDNILTNKNIDFRNKDKALKQLESAFYEVKALIDHPDEDVYVMSSAKLIENDEINLRVIKVSNNSRGERLVRVKIDDPDYGFWVWAIYTRRLDGFIPKSEVHKLMEVYNEKR